MVSKESSHVLSDVHTDCQFQMIPDSNYAVTRFKLYFPTIKNISLSMRLTQQGSTELQKTDSGKLKQTCLVHDTLLNASSENTSQNKPKDGSEMDPPIELHGKSGNKLNAIHFEAKAQFDEDGDPVIDRHECRNEDSDNERNFQESSDFEQNKSPNKCCHFDADTSKYVDSGVCNCRNSCWSEEERNVCFKDDTEVSPGRKKIKLDLSDSLPPVKQKQDNFDKLKDSIEKEKNIVDSDISYNTVLEDTCSCGSNCNVTEQHFHDEGVSELPVKKSCSVCVQGKCFEKGKQKMVNKSKSLQVISNKSVQAKDRHRVVSGTRRKAEQGKCSMERDKDPSFDICYLSIKHSLATDLEDVGEQVWHGALLLSDYIISFHGDFENKVIIELGAGVGLTSIVAAMYAKRVYCTDTGEQILSLAEDNVCTATTCPTLPRPMCKVLVKQLDWFTGLVVEKCKHGLTEDDISSIYNCDILVAADVIYDFDMTDAFFNVVKQVMNHPPAKTLYIGLEKRLVFTVEDLAVTSPCYNYFRLHLDDLCNNEETDAEVSFEVEQMNTEFQKHFMYKRIKQLEVWKITAILRKRDN